MDKKWKVLGVKSLLKSRWLSIDQETCQLPNGKIINDFYTMNQPEWVLILPRTVKGTWLIENQYRHGTQTASMEFPAGIIEPGESPLQAAKRELQEECACFGEQWTDLGTFPMNPDRHRGHFFVFFVDNVMHKGDTNFDDTEDIDSFEVSTEELEHKMQTGEFNHPLQMAAYLKWCLLDDKK